MRIFKPLAAVAAAILFCAPALAADKPAGLDPRKVAEARALADTTITRLGVGDYFENASDGEMARVRHKASRMVCMIADEAAPFDIRFADGVPRGDDVTCSSQLLGPETQRAVRYDRPPSLDAALDQAVGALRAEVDGMKPYRGTAVQATSELAKTIPLATARFTGRQNGQPVYARVTVFISGDWVYVHKVIAPANVTDAAELIAELELVMEIIELIKPDGSAG